MSSPNEPGYPRAGDGPGGANGSVNGPPSATGSPAGHGTESGDVPPWQRGPGGRAARPQRRQPQEPADAETPRAGSAAGHTTGDSGGLDARLNRFISGGSGPVGSRPTDAGARRARRAPRRPSRGGASRGLRQRAAGPVRARAAPAAAAQARAGAAHRAGTGEPARAGHQPHPGGHPAQGSGAGQHADPAGRPVERAEGVAGAVGRTVLRVDDRRGVPVSGARRHGCVEQAEQQRRRPAHQRQRQTAASWCPAAPSSAAPR